MAGLVGFRTVGGMVKAQDKTKQVPAGRPPRPRTRKGAAVDSVAERAAFERRAQEWMLGRPGRQVELPGELGEVVRLGVPCGTCGEVVHLPRSERHTVSYRPASGGHWTAGITAECRS